MLDETLASHVRRRIHQHDEIELVGIQDLEQKRDVVDEDRVATHGGLGDELRAPFPNRRVDDAVEARPGGIVVEDASAKPRTVERSVGQQHVSAKGIDDGGVRRRPGCLNFAHELVGIQHRRAPRGEVCGHDRLAARYVAGEPHCDHGSADAADVRDHNRRVWSSSLCGTSWQCRHRAS